jgi:hypothetical protein
VFPEQKLIPSIQSGITETQETGETDDVVYILLEATGQSKGSGQQDH